jgi:pimeloyl-ACP methyl ester carboxylesterase
MEHFARSNGIEIHYLEHPGEGPTLVLLPGLTANAHTFDGLVRAGLGRCARVLALDLRGRGASDQPSVGYGMAEHAADVVGLLDALDLDRVVLGGHSFGGLLSLYIAAHHPERATKLVIIDAAASLHPSARELLQPALDRLGRVFPSWEAYLQAMQAMPYFIGWWDPLIESSYRAEIQSNADGSVQARSRPETIAAALEGVLIEPWTEHVTRIHQPTLLLNALGPYGPPGSPPLVPRAQAEATVRALAQGRYVEIPGNHVTMLYGEGAAAIVDAVSLFLS